MVMKNATATNPDPSPVKNWGDSRYCIQQISPRLTLPDALLQVFSLGILQ